MRLDVCKIFTFDSAHQLVNHDGKCANVHGHTYKLEVVVHGPVIDKEGDPKEGFVIDFTDLKKVVKAYIVDPMDHAFLAQGNEPILPTLKESGSKIYYLGFRSTCENMSVYICETLMKLFPEFDFTVRLWETPTGWAEASSRGMGAARYSEVGGCDHA